MRFDFRFVAITALLLGSACTGASGTKPNAPANPDATQQIPGDAANGGNGGGDANGPAVTPVDAPGEVVLHVRWSNPGATAATMAGYANLPASQVNATISQAVKELLRDGLGGKVDVDAFAKLVRTDAPIDIVLIADMDVSGQVPEPMFAISIGLTSVQAALQASKGSPRSIGEQVWEIGTQDKWGEPCAVAAAIGKAPARLVCADRKKHMEKVAAFVARNVAMKPDPRHDIRVEVSLRGMLDRYGRQWANQAKGLPVLVEEIKIGNPKFDQALMDAADALASEAGALIHDADSFVLDVGLNSNKGAHVGVKLQFAGKQSWMVQAMLDGAQNSGPAPDIVWQVPQSASYVTWGTSGDPKRFDAIVAAAKAMLEGMLEKEKIGSAADRRALGSLVRIVARGKHVPSVMAAGHFQNVNTKPTNIAQVLDDAIGWYLVGFDEKPAAVKRWIQDAVKVYNRPTIQKLVKHELGSYDAKHLPRVKAIVVPPGLGGGGLALEVAIPEIDDPMGSALRAAPGTGKPKRADIKTYLILMGDGARTWVGFAGDKAELVKMMVGVKGVKVAGAKIRDITRLGSRTGLSRMRSESHNSGAFSSLDGVVGMVKPIIYAMMAAPGAGSAATMGKEALKIIAQMPNKGMTPILMFSDVQGGPKPSVTWSLDVARGTLEDIGFVGQSAFDMFAR